MSHAIDYDGIAARFERRYELFAYAGVSETLLKFAGDSTGTVAEIGCGSGHWLALLSGRGVPTVGVDPARRMLMRAREAAPRARLVRGRATPLPLAGACCDRVVSVNALHHFGDRFAFFLEARRVLRPGGGVMTIGLDPHADRDRWWVYDYFDGTRDRDLARFAPVRTIRGELARAGFAWAESFEADHIDTRVTVQEALASGVTDRTFSSELGLLSDEEYERGLARLHRAARDRALEGDTLSLATDLRLYATVGWV